MVLRYSAKCMISFQNKGGNRLGVLPNFSSSFTNYSSWNEGYLQKQMDHVMEFEIVIEGFVIQVPKKIPFSHVNH